jgi:FHA domain-containing protein
MKIAVVNVGGGVASGLAADFDAGGGTIGRAKTNHLVLDDPDRTVSRVHAEVICRNGAFFIVDQGSNPLLLNGVSLGAGNEARLQPGDTLQIGSFGLSVSQGLPSAQSSALLDDLTMSGSSSSPSQAASSDDPFADLLAGLTPVAAPAPKAAPKAAALDSFPDPMGIGSAASSPNKLDSFDDLLNFGAPSAGNVPAAASTDAFEGLGNASASSIDELFGLGGGSSGDPFVSTPLGSAMQQPNTASSSDPLFALQGGARPTAASRSDHVPALQQAYALPKALDARPAPMPAPVPAPAPALAPQATPVARQPVAAPRHTSSASDSELLAAFLRGVKSTHQMPTELTPELMERIGAMLHTAAHGTLQLLVSRQEFKHGVRSEVTMISVEANNPLKFSPNAEVALAHMLGPKVKGFMQAEEAMLNAYADLRAHQLAVMVGMRSALAHVIERFTPDKLESRLTEKSKLDALFAANRKAKLWDQFCLLYTSIASEAEDDFHKLFGEAFAKAYDEQMARFKSDR